jgi:hypothetical protein
LQVATGARYALIRGLRRIGGETQLTQALAAVLSADDLACAGFVGLLVKEPGAATIEFPERFGVTAEDVSGSDRFDLRFDAPGWDVIVELKIHAGYGPNQLERYREALLARPQRHLVAITRDVPFYGEPSDVRVFRWRQLLGPLRDLPFRDSTLKDQWLLFLDVLEEEGSMGFTRPDAKLFSQWADASRATKHIEEFVEAVRAPVIEALRDALGGDEGAADFYRGRGNRPVLSRAQWGKADMPIRVPADGPIRLRVGMFGANPPPRFFVALHNGRTLSAKRNVLSSDARAGIAALEEDEFRSYDLHAFFDLTEDRLSRDDIEEVVVGWAHDRFVAVAKSGVLDALTADERLKPASGVESDPDDPVDDAEP